MGTRWPFSSSDDRSFSIPSLALGLLSAWVITSFAVAGTLFAVPHGVHWVGLVLGLGLVILFATLVVCIPMTAQVENSLTATGVVAALATGAERLRSHHVLLEHFTPAVVTGFVLPMLTILVAALLDETAASIHRNFNERWFRRHPDERAVIVLTSTLANLAEFSDIHTSPAAKRDIAGALEDLAQAAERDLFRALRCGETATATWLRQDCQAIATAFRVLKRSVYLPRVGSWDRLRTELANDLSLMARGCWGELPREESERTRLRQHLPMILSVARALLVGSVPAAILIPAFHFGLMNLPHPIDTYLQTGVLVWGVMTLITAIHPELAGRVVAAIPTVTGVMKRG
jgi:hypothetical protein